MRRAVDILLNDTPQPSNNTWHTSFAMALRTHLYAFSIVLTLTLLRRKERGTLWFKILWWTGGRSRCVCLFFWTNRSLVTIKTCSRVCHILKHMGRRQWYHHDDIKKSKWSNNDVGVTSTLNCIQGILRKVKRFHLKKHFPLRTDVAVSIVQYLPYCTCALQETKAKGRRTRRDKFAFGLSYLYLLLAIE